MLLKGNLQGLQHLGIPVTDLERSKAFYMQLGFSEVMRTDIPSQSEPIRVAMMQHENFTIELYELGQERRQEIATRSDGHIDHVALNVLDIEQALCGDQVCWAGNFGRQRASLFAILGTRGEVFHRSWSGWRKGRVQPNFESRLNHTHWEYQSCEANPKDTEPPATKDPLSLSVFVVNESLCLITTYAVQRIHKHIRHLLDVDLFRNDPKRFLPHLSQTRHI